MNEQTTKLIEQLANKLGTTSEYLWEILVKQAPIQAGITVVEIIAIVILGNLLWKAHKKMSEKIEGGSYLYDNLYEKNMGIATAMIVLTLIWCLCVIGLLFSLDSIIYGIFNPEYWALKQVLNILGSR